MKAIVYTEFGPPEVLQLKEVATPAPKDHEILVRVHASTVNYGDTVARNFRNMPAGEFHMPMPLWLPMRLAFGLRQPRKPILGNEFAGEVAAVGQDVTRFRLGDQVFGYRGQSMGAYAEYLCTPADGTVAIKPAPLTYAEAATVPYGAMMALAILRKADIQPGQKVLVNGASGGIGAAAVQLAKHGGAEVTGVCGTPRVEYVRSLGADKVIDYTREDFTQNGETYDLIVDILGKSSFARCEGSLTENGIYLLVSFKMKAVFQMAGTSLPGRQAGKRVICAMASEKPEDLDFIRDLVEAGKFKAIVDRCYPLEQTAEAHRYVESGLKQGPVSIIVNHDHAL